MNVAYQAIQAKQLGCQGYALFRYAWLENPVAAEELANLKMFAF
jgi:L-alanine-DL-glutamate epimerase-like enolase superfamily enzyme